MFYMFLFFFQAEDGIRDVAVTGVQTCALPICEPAGEPRVRARDGRVLRAAADRVRRGCGVAGVGRRRRPAATGGILEGAPQSPAGVVPVDRPGLDLGVPPPRGARTPRDHRIGGDARLPAP